VELGYALPGLQKLLFLCVAVAVVLGAATTVMTFQVVALVRIQCSIA